ncbi:MAG: hypothetical protein QOE22_273 [Candidatus Parcubacteria bacterium]|jgi:nitroimidazol reductase NimA-like FMN-containing flavoprotein (pyridoxamine 5'-phosphate oxidase superfamily)|nr:hypothetical protein [Candidatus Parcubacteria bacterium]
MNNEEIKKKILAFLNLHKLTVISTVDTENNKPEAACVAFAEKENLDLIFGTLNNSRKYKNLQTNQNVSFVIGWSDELGTVQYEGIARELSGDEAQENGEIMAIKKEKVRGYLTREDNRFFLVKPTWIRFVDKGISPEEVSEVNLFDGN